MGRPKKIQTPENLTKEIVNASLGHIKENQTFAAKPQTELENVTKIEHLSNKTRGLNISE